MTKKWQMTVDRREVLTNTLAGIAVLSPAAKAAGVSSTMEQQGSDRKYRAVTETVKIPMRDGVELSALMVRPVGILRGQKCPALFLYDPYRGSERDGPGRFAYFAEHGYYCFHLDVRGTGASAGKTTINQYSEQEQRDGLDAIAWIASQPWCDSNVGMFGSSYGGFNSIQMAMLQPPALKAIVPIFATDNVFTDDIAYYDGALQGESLGRWPFFMMALMGIPAAPDFDTETDQARYRVEQEPWLFEMLRRQSNDEFWQRQSLAPNYEDIKIPTFMIGGWLDAYTDSVPRMLQRMSAPTKALIGPWTHGMGLPGPEIDVPFEILRWWDYWLKGIDTGVMSEPRLAMYVNHSYKPSLTLESVPGEWRYEDGWPIARVKKWKLYPQPNQKLLEEAVADVNADLEYKPTVGMTNRYRCPHNTAELPVDQRPDDSFSLVFDSEPLEEDIEILGFPEAELYVSSTAPVANWIVRLCDVAPDGTSTLVTKGILNGTHYDSHEKPERLKRDRTYKLEIDLKVISWVFPKGHRIRFAVANADFPNLWPTPYAMSTSLFVDEARPSSFSLPVCPPGQKREPKFKFPETPRSAARNKPNDEWVVTRDEMAKTVTVYRQTVYGELSKPGELAMYEKRWITASDVNPYEASLLAEGQYQVKRGEDVLSCKTSLDLRSDEDTLHMSARRELYVNDGLKYQKEWRDSIRRKFV